MSVHYAVALAFIGPRPAGLEICHANGDPSDNRLVNLRYDTRSANAIDAVKHGRVKCCQEARFAKLTNDQVRCIRATYVRGSKSRGQAYFAQKFGTAQSTISFIVNGVNWQHLDELHPPTLPPK